MYESHVSLPLNSLCMFIRTDLCYFGENSLLKLEIVIVLFLMFCKNMLYIPVIKKKSNIKSYSKGATDS